MGLTRGEGCEGKERKGTWGGGPGCRKGVKDIVRDLVYLRERGSTSEREKAVGLYLSEGGS